MGALEIVPFSTDHVTGAARVLAARHGQHLATQPLLATDPDFAHLVAEQYSSSTSGFVAVRAGEVTGFLLGQRAVNMGEPHIWCAAAAHAVIEPDLTFDLYQAAAEGWVASGLTRHFVYLPAIDEYVDPWFRLGFGASAYQAARSTADDLAPRASREIVVRPTRREDLEASARLERQQFLHLKTSPSFSEIVVDEEATFLEEWHETLENELFSCFVAEYEGRVVGELFLYRRAPGDLRVPARSIDLAGCSTDPAFRGRGVGYALTSFAITWAREAGYETLISDWRATNLLAARYWPHRGFRETYVRLYRSIP